MTIKIKRATLILLTIIVVISTLLIGLCIGCVITPGSIVITKEKIVTEPCNHIDLNEVGVLEQSVTKHCDRCNSPAQRILYDSKNEITYIYTYYYKYRDGYSHMLELKNTEILRIQADGTSVIVKR